MPFCLHSFFSPSCLARSTSKVWDFFLFFFFPTPKAASPSFNETQTFDFSLDDGNLIGNYTINHHVRKKKKKKYRNVYLLPQTNNCHQRGHKLIVLTRLDSCRATPCEKVQEHIDNSFFSFAICIF